MKTKKCSVLRVVTFHAVDSQSWYLSQNPEMMDRGDDDRHSRDRYIEHQSIRRPTEGQKGTAARHTLPTIAAKILRGRRTRYRCASRESMHGHGKISRPGCSRPLRLASFLLVLEGLLGPRERRVRCLYTHAVRPGKGITSARCERVYRGKHFVLCSSSGEISHPFCRKLQSFTVRKRKTYLCIIWMWTKNGHRC